MRARGTTTGLTLGALLLSGVGCDPPALVQSPVCEALLACGQPQQACDVFEQALVTAQCAALVLNAPCSEHAANVPSYLDTCFPACTGAAPECVGVPVGTEGCPDRTDYACQLDGTLRTCERLAPFETDGESMAGPVDQAMRLVVLRCERACEFGGQRFTGICGPTFGNMGEATDADHCWCR